MRSKMPRFVELFNASSIIPNTKYMEYELKESLGMVLDEARGLCIQPNNLLPIYSYSMESALIKEMLKLHNCNQSEVALILGVNRGALRHLIDRYQINVELYK